MTAEKNELSFSVLNDVGNEVARRFAPVFGLPQELRDFLIANDTCAISTAMIPGSDLSRLHLLSQRAAAWMSATNTALSPELS